MVIYYALKIFGTKNVWFKKSSRNFLLRDLSTAYLPPSSSYPTSYAEPEDLYKVI